MEFVLGALFSGLRVRRFGQFSHDEFPPPPRLCTTAFRYYRSLYMYAAWAVILFLILAMVPTAILIATLSGGAGLDKTLPPVAYRGAAPHAPPAQVPAHARDGRIDPRLAPRPGADPLARPRHPACWILSADYQADTSTAPTDDAPLEALGTTPSAARQSANCCVRADAPGT